MALTQNQGNVPKKIRVRTLRPWRNVVRDGDGNPLVSVIEVDEVVDVPRDLAGDVISSGKAVKVDDETPLGKKKVAKAA